MRQKEITHGTLVTPGGICPDFSAHQGEMGEVVGIKWFLGIRLYTVLYADGSREQAFAFELDPA